ncbi:SDR family NAD(P)-dependent oxidoreductase [Streptomyces sp. SID3343]|uniref:SDR family NAD(P)-dependent oxidoreductase n=1 Tax=Streptomyces sp. SID3343 TaxID=2690260 RepID=UPI00136F1C2E|nr:SDR family NAD(P)-dependent oxidoreductase [Streptomyces sp. SID3343]MYV97896.1 glucose 1-dehydrogenase [Streptomyces sp. SID3343]
MGQLDGRVAVVTGGANGIGRACCERFAEEGADVVIADILDEPAMDTIAAVEKRGGRAAYMHTDASSPTDTETVMQHAIDMFGAIDVLVTAAGISTGGYVSGRPGSEVEVERDPIRRFTEGSLADWQHVLDVNLTGTLLAVRAAARHMHDLGRRGSIITIASIAAKHPGAGAPAYAVSKAGVWMLTKQAALILGPAGIRVNAIGPGFIETDMTAVVRGMPELEQRLLASVPLGRLGNAREVANAALFLASDQSSYFTGEMLHPDGGFYTD